jgi:single-strand DNA-binding protein
MQNITITGRIGGDAETRQAGSGNVTNFNCAVDQGWGDNKQTNWYRVAIWGERGGKLAPYILKGQKVAVTGELVIGEYQGKPQYEIRAADVDCFMSAKGEGSQPQPSSQSRAPAQSDLDDDVPF